MRNNRKDNTSRYLLSIIATVISISLVMFYFWAEPYLKGSIWKEFLQSLSVNILSVTLPFVIVYIFIDRKNLWDNSTDFSYNKFFGEIDARIAQFKDEILSGIDNSSQEDGTNTSSSNHDLSANNELYTFFGLKKSEVGIIFQDFSVSRDGDKQNINAVSFLWADTLFGNTINAKIINDIQPFLSVEFQSFAPSWGCNVAIRPQNEKAINISNNTLKYLFFQARIPLEALQDSSLLHDVGISIRLVNGKYQHWDYGNKPGEYIQFLVRNDAAWTPICINLQNKTSWCHFDSDGNPNVKDDEKYSVDLSIISAVIIKFGKYIPNTHGELGYGHGRVDIRDIRLSANYIN